MSGQIRSGYKQTEVGLIPDDWSAISLGSLTTLMTNGFVGTATKHYAENENGVLYIQGYNVEENSFNLRGIKYVTDDFHKAHAKSCLRAGDLLTVQTGDVGLTTIIPDDLAGSNCHALIISRFDKKRTNPGYVSYYLNSTPGRSRLRLIETGTTMKHLNVGDMLEFLVPAPPTLAEQDAIAEALSDTDALIESLEQLLAKKRHLKQGTMQGLLTGEKRLPGFSGEWEVKRLGDVVDQFVGGGTPSRSNPTYWGDEIPWVTVKDFATFNPHNSQEAITRTGLHNSASHLIPRGTLITSTRMALGKAVIYEVDVAINQDLKALFPKSILDTHYLYFWFQYHGQSIDELGSGSTVKGISLPDLKKIEFQLPSVSEQTAIAAVLSDMDTEITELETQLAKTRTLKQGMMHKLLTGEIRLL